MKQKISITLDEKTLKKIDHLVDHIYIRNRSAAIEQLITHALGENKVAVILCGGSEAALKLNETTFRPTAQLHQKSVVEFAVMKLCEEGFRQLYFVARHNILTAVFNILRDGHSYGVSLDYIEETESRGSADSLRLLQGKINSSFLVVYGDIIFNTINLGELWKHHLKQQGIATLLLTTSPTPTNKGIVKIEGNRILKFIQKPKYADIYLGFSSIFACEPEIFHYHGNSLEIDIFPVLAERGLLYGHLSSEKEVHIHTLHDAKNYQKMPLW